MRQASELEASWTNVRGLSARIALFGDNASATLLDWLGLAFPNNSVCHISESYIAHVSPRDSSYNVLVENTGNKRGHGSAGSTGLKMGQSC
ncbi:MAG: hypothetical protein ACK40C_13745 [Novosphingobium meiothermophilum]